MCKCTPEIRTPFCGKPGCEWPDQKPAGARDEGPAPEPITALEVDPDLDLARVALDVINAARAFDVWGKTWSGGPPLVPVDGFAKLRAAFAAYDEVVARSKEPAG